MCHSGKCAQENLTQECALGMALCKEEYRAVVEAPVRHVALDTMAQAHRLHIGGESIEIPRGATENQVGVLLQNMGRLLVRKVTVQEYQRRYGDADPHPEARVECFPDSEEFQRDRLHCDTCQDTGQADTGASLPWGEWVTVSCPDCRSTQNYSDVNRSCCAHPGCHSEERCPECGR